MTTLAREHVTAARDGAPEGARRAVTLLAVGAILLTTPSLWAAATSVAPPSQHGGAADPRLHGALLVLTALSSALLLAAGIVATATRSARVLRIVDAVVLAVGSAVLTGIVLLLNGISDEGVLTDRAATAFLQGQPVYGVAWKSLFAGGKIALTPTMSGGADYSYGYPPGALLLVAGFRAVVGHAAAAPALIGVGALIVAVVAAWLLTPGPWRSLVTTAGFGASMLPNDARAGYPAVIALALLVPVIAAWHRTGRDGVLGRAGLLRAAALGAACAVHQTAWFYVPFLVVGVWALRRPEVGGRRALLVAARYALVGAAVWILIDLPFAVRQPLQWFEGILLPITQHAIVHGQGLIAVTEYLMPGSGAIAWFGAAQAALLLALVVLLALHPRRLAVALPILPALPYLLGTRSSADYLVLFLPLWLLAALTVPIGLAAPEGSTAVATWGAPRPTQRTRAIVAVALLVPALVCAVVAVATPSPLAVRVVAVATSNGAVQSATVTASNTGGVPIRPHFLSRAGTHPSFWWHVRSGAAVIPAGGSVRYVITPAARGTARLIAQSRDRAVLMVLSDAPQTLTTVPFPG
ncbi:MAG: hypothetical protein HIU86_10925 [Acidobacteria bacterium]|nr:hypothetical protein [Acidobacteriota bacterium]